ncbi:MAG: hypothetical protein H6625_00645 [Bdellovibrionaceae bacterium]|nr:hypothetical protein [Pseudobdellovibrionaceae bacterium]
MKNKNPIKFLLNSYGNTLMSVLIASSLGILIMSGLIDFLLRQYKSQNHLSRKYELMDLKQNLLIVFQDPNVCTYNLRPATAYSDSANIHFDATTWDDPATEIDESNGRIELLQLSSGTSPSSPPLAIKGQPLPGTQTGIVVESIKLKNLQPVNPTAAPSSRLQWQGIWEISVAPISGHLPLKPVQIAQRFVVADTVDSPETDRRINFCLGASPTGLVQIDRVFKGTLPRVMGAKIEELASTNGFVQYSVAIGGGDSARTRVCGYVGTTPNPGGRLSCAIAQDSPAISSAYEIDTSSGVFLVKKGEYWKVEVNAIDTLVAAPVAHGVEVYWSPLY